MGRGEVGRAGRRESRIKAQSQTIRKGEIMRKPEILL